MLYLTTHTVTRDLIKGFQKSWVYIIFTARKLSLGQGNVFAGVCLSTGGLTSEHVSQVTWPRDLYPKGSASGRGLHPWGLPTHCRVCLWWVGQTAQDPRYMGYYGIRSTSRQYASYWNAFLFVISLHSWKCSAHITIIMFRINF